MIGTGNLSIAADLPQHFAEVAVRKGREAKGVIRGLDRPMFGSKAAS